MSTCEATLGLPELHYSGWAWFAKAYCSSGCLWFGMSDDAPNAVEGDERSAASAVEHLRWCFWTLDRPGPWMA